LYVDPLLELGMIKYTRVCFKSQMCICYATLIIVRRYKKHTF